MSRRCFVFAPRAMRYALCIVGAMLSALGFSGALLFALSVPAEAQPTKKIPRVGILRATTPTLAAPLNEAFRQGLRDVGYEEGKNIVIEYRFAEGNPARTPNLAAELARLNVDIIVAPGGNEARAAKNATNNSDCDRDSTRSRQ